jgi:hypothetical protein
MEASTSEAAAVSPLIARSEFRCVKFGRFWAVYEDEALVCLTVYKKGAHRVIERLMAATGDRKRARAPAATHITLPHK